MVKLALQDKSKEELLSIRSEINQLLVTGATSVIPNELLITLTNKVHTAITYLNETQSYDCVEVIVKVPCLIQKDYDKIATIVIDSDAYIEDDYIKPAIRKQVSQKQNTVLYARLINFKKMVRDIRKEVARLSKKYDVDDSLICVYVNPDRDII